MATERGSNRYRRRFPNVAARPSLRRLGRLWPALVEAPIEDVLGDAVLHHLDRAARDHPAAAAPHAPFHQAVLAVAHGAHDLHRLARHFEAGLVAGGLGDRGLVGRGQPTIGIGRRAIEQELRAFELDRHLGELPLQALELAQRPAELVAGRGMLARLVEGVAAEGERAGGIAEALDVEAGHLLLEAAGSEQDILCRDAAILEMQLAPLLAAHEARRLADGEARRIALDDHRADAADPGPVAHIDEEDRGVPAEGGEHLAAIDDVVRAVRLGAGLELGRGRAGIGLADAEAHHHASLDEVGQPARLLLRRAVFGEGADRAEIAELHHVGAARAGGSDLLDGDDGVSQCPALAAVGLRQRDAHQPLRTHQLRHLEGEAWIVRARERIRLELGACEALHGLGEGLLLFGEVELHVVLSGAYYTTFVMSDTLAAASFGGSPVQSRNRGATLPWRRMS